MNRDRLKIQTFLAIARTLGELSTCDRASVGAVIVREGRCISWGFNGAPPGLPHCGENMHGYGKDHPYFQHGQLQSSIDIFLSANGCINATHAETNALAYAARQGTSTDGATLFVTVSPCVTCARLLIAAGIKHVVYETAYRDPSGVKLLEQAGIPLSFEYDVP
jgi:dCMP deaminase